MTRSTRRPPRRSLPSLDEDFDPAEFPPPKRTEPCRLYLISPQDVGGNFPDRLRSVVGFDCVTAFQLRVKDVSEDELSRLAEPLQRICADAGVSRASVASKPRAARA